MIHFDSVSKRYPGGQEGLSNISFRIEAGEMVFLTGHSGAGKSTLIKLIGLLERPTRGQVWVNQRNLNHLPRRDVAFHRREVGIIFQDHRLLTDRTVFDNIALPLVVAGVAPREIQRRVRAALDKVGLLKKEKAHPLMLSGGEQQRVGIARAVVGKPPILLADEPTGNLDAELAREIMGLFRLFNQLGVTVLIATHALELVAESGARAMVLRQGGLIADREQAHDH